MGTLGRKCAEADGPWAPPPASEAFPHMLPQRAEDYGPVEVISHWHPNITINIVDDHTPWVKGSVPPPLDQCKLPSPASCLQRPLGGCSGPISLSSGPIHLRELSRAPLSQAPHPVLSPSHVLSLSHTPTPGVTRTDSRMPASVHSQVPSSPQTVFKKCLSLANF